MDGAQYYIDGLGSDPSFNNLSNIIWCGIYLNNNGCQVIVKRMKMLMYLLDKEYLIRSNIKLQEFIKMRKL